MCRGLCRRPLDFSGSHLRLAPLLERPLELLDLEEGIGRLRLGDRGVPQPFGDLLDRHAMVLEEPAAAGAAQIVPAHVLDLRPPAGGLEAAVQMIETIGLAAPLAWDAPPGIDEEEIDLEVCRQSCRDLRGARQERHFAPVPAALGVLGMDDHAAVSDLRAAEREHLLLAEPRVDGEGDGLGDDGRGFLEDRRFLRMRQIAAARGRLAERAAFLAAAQISAHRVDVEPLPIDAATEHRGEAGEIAADGRRRDAIIAALRLELRELGAADLVEIEALEAFGQAVDRGVVALRCARTQRRQVLLGELQDCLVEGAPLLLAPRYRVEAVEPFAKPLLRNCFRRCFKGLPEFTALTLDTSPPLPAAPVDGCHAAPPLSRSRQYRQKRSSSKRHSPLSPLGWQAPGILPALASRVNQRGEKPVRAAR